MKKNKILCIMQLPPPFHGASYMNSLVAESKILNDFFIIDILNLSYVSRVEQIGKINFTKFLNFIKYLVMMINKIIFNRPELIYFTISPYGISFLRDSIFVFFIKIFRIKLVLHMHGKGAKNNYHRHKFVYDYVFKNVSVICLAEKLKKDVLFYNGNPFVISNGIPIIQNNSININYSNSDVINILYVSNFIKSKGVLDLLESVKIIIKTNPNIKVQLIGDYSNEITPAFLKSYINDNLIENKIEIVGPKYGDEKYNYFSNADIFAFPTYYINETFGLVNLEAMQFSLPIVSTYEGGIPEVIENNVTGYLVEQRNIEQLAKKISFLVENKDLRLKMGKLGRKRFEEKFTYDIFINNIKETFLKIINDKA